MLTASQDIIFGLSRPFPVSVWHRWLQRSLILFEKQLSFEGGGWSQESERVSRDPARAVATLCGISCRAWKISSAVRLFCALYSESEPTEQILDTVFRVVETNGRTLLCFFFVV